MFAVTYGWTEDYVFSLPWDRVEAYMVEIGIYHDQPVHRSLKPLPELKKLQELYKIKAEQRRKEILKSLNP